ncbi:MAG: PQQ-dependent sugar dehydrogenase [Saprospiraceae bacterium]
MKKIFTLFLLGFSSICIFAQTIELEEYATGFLSPVDITHADDNRLFVVERSGRIKIIDENATVLSTPFLDIDNIVANASGQSERGLLGLAFHPDYINNGYFFVNYIDNSGDTQIARYSRDNSNINIADPNSETIILTIDQPDNTTNHNGGCIKFGPDGYLYIGMGDGGSGNDPWNNSQDTETLLGKMLRIDIDNGSPYSIPTDNPFVNDANVLDEIWAIGVRNPWRFSFDRETGDLWIADVGQNAWEEIDFQPANSPGGENYGWRCYEGNHLNGSVNTSNCGSASDYVAPIYEVQHSGFTGPCSVTGGFVYRGEDYPDLEGIYIFADYCTGEIFTVTPDGSGGWVGQEVADFNYDISTFGEDVDGELYCARLGQGRIYKVVSNACASLAVSVNVTSEPCEGETNGMAQIGGAGGTPPYTFSPNLDLNNLAADNYNITITDDAGCTSTESFTVNSLSLPTVPTITVNDNLLTAPNTYTAYQWYFNGQIIAGATNETYTFFESGNYTVVVTGGNGCTNTSMVISVTTSIKNIPALNEITITPNPFDKDIFIEISVNKAIDLELEILDLNGKLILAKNISIKDKYAEGLNLEHLSNGVYYLNLKSEQDIIVKKIIKN